MHKSFNAQGIYIYKHSWTHALTILLNSHTMNIIQLVRFNTVHFHEYTSTILQLATPASKHVVFSLIQIYEVFTLPHSTTCNTSKYTPCILINTNHLYIYQIHFIHCITITIATSTYKSEHYLYILWNHLFHSTYQLEYLILMLTLQRSTYNWPSFSVFSCLIYYDMERSIIREGVKIKTIPKLGVC